jgi:hypothetical protein
MRFSNTRFGKLAISREPFIKFRVFLVQIEVDDLPVDDLPFDDLPVDDLPFDDLPVDDLPFDDLPVDDLPVDDLPFDDLPVDDLPVDDLPFDDLPVDDLPSTNSLREIANFPKRVLKNCKNWPTLHAILGHFPTELFNF